MQGNKGIQAPVFNIVHGSFVDGWGVRTTVFLKGCPLRCLWCCNPEGQKLELELKYTEADCNGCGQCVTSCSLGAIRMSESLSPHALIDRKLCNNCLRCIESCYTNALGSFGTMYTVDELFQMVKKDMRYFGTDGGVTIGGGEATVYPEFTLELLKKCKAAFIHTALDTCGYITTSVGIAALAEADLVLYDIKGMDEKNHYECTGVSNKVILENLLYRDSLKKEIIIRLPIIPNYTDSEDNLIKTADFLATLKSVRRVDILPFHRYGTIKYEQLGLLYSLGNSKEITNDRLEVIKKIFEKRNLNAQIGG